MMNTVFTGKVYKVFEELASTNEYAVEWLSKNRPAEGAAVRADKQSAGKGQFGSTWKAEAGQNLLISIIYYPDWLPIERQFFLSMAVALAVRETTEDFLPNHPARIKWPNDIYLNHGKTAGILIQNQISGHALSASVIGVGINVNQTQFDADLPNPTSIAAVSGQNHAVEAVAKRLFERLEMRYLQLKSGDDIKAEYEALLYARGEIRRFTRTADNTVFEGKILGVTDAGRLRMLTRSGEENFDLKEVQIILNE